MNSMEKPAKILTIVNYVSSGILWLLGILTFVFNLFGLWEPWHLAGFGFVFYAPVEMVLFIITLVFSAYARNKKLIIANLIALLVSIFFVLFTVFVSAGWFW